MKRLFAALLALVIIIGTSCVATAADEAFMGLSATGDWHIFSRNMEDEALLDAVGMSAREINKVLENTSSESIIVNAKTNAVIYVKLYENDKSKALWNISQTDDAYLLQNLNDILHNGFLVHELDYKTEDVKISTANPDFKQIIVPGSTNVSDSVHGMVISGTFVNGKAVAFVMETKGDAPTEEEISALEEVTGGIEITKIRDKSEKSSEEESQNKESISQYVIGGLIALVVVVLCAVAMTKMKNNDEEQEDNEETDNE